MRLATFSVAGERRVGRVSAEGRMAAPFELSVEAARAGVTALIGRALPRTLSPLPLDRVVLEAPIPRPRRNIFCVGKNCRDHAAAGVVPQAPILFPEVPEAVVGNGEEVEIDAAVSAAIDYEGELAVIIGASGRGIPERRAMAHVWGYTIVNDVTARDLQARHSQWLIGKSQDGFCPMVPFAVSADGLDLATAGLRTLVNGALRQEARFRDLIFSIPRIIADLSAGLTLCPGDIIATGTPAGVGIGFTPPRYLTPGDTVRVEVEGIGGLENRFVARRA